VRKKSHGLDCRVSESSLDPRMLASAWTCKLGCSHRRADMADYLAGEREGGGGGRNLGHFSSFQKVEDAEVMLRGWWLGLGEDASKRNLNLHVLFVYHHIYTQHTCTHAHTYIYIRNKYAWAPTTGCTGEQRTTVAHWWQSRSWGSLQCVGYDKDQRRISAIPIWLLHNWLDTWVWHASDSRVLDVTLMGAISTELIWVSYWHDSWERHDSWRRYDSWMRNEFAHSE